MSESPKDHQKVISFLKQYRPLPPAGNPSLESQLIHQVSRESQSNYRKAHLWIWLIPGAVIASLAAIGSHERWFQPAYQLGDRENSTELETFMVESWQETMGEMSTETSYRTLYSDWLALENPEKQYVVSSP